MTAIGWLQVLLFALLILAITKPVGIYLYQVYEGERRPLESLLGPLERGLYALCGVDPRREQTWLQYAFGLLAFSAVSLLVSYAMLRLQAVLPLNPQGFAAVSEHLSWNTAASFTTNTNWQS